MKDINRTEIKIESKVYTDDSYGVISEFRNKTDEVIG